jgi:HAMP domain-containing protein
MWRSLRFRLPALFLAGILLSGFVASGLAFRLFQQFQVAQARSELSREVAGITELYENQARRVSDEGKAAPDFAAGNLERATGDLIYYVGVDFFPGQISGLRTLSRAQFNAVDADLSARHRTPWEAILDGRRVQFEFSPPDREKTYLGIAQPLRLDRVGPPFGAVVVAKPKAQLSERLSALLWRLTIAFLGGILVAGGLGWYLSRRITRPVLAVAKAADEVARGNYAVDVPDVPGGGEVSQLAERFKVMAHRLKEAEELERNFLMTVSHELRTPLTAIRGHVEALREGLVEDEELERRSAATSRRCARASSRTRSSSRSRCAWSRTRRRGSSGSSETSSTSRSSTRTASPSSTRRSTWGGSSTSHTRPSARRRAGAGSTTGRRGTTAR